MKYNDENKEQCPLLDDTDDNDDIKYFVRNKSNAVSKRRFKISTIGKARDKMKGAAFIITQWPDDIFGTYVNFWLVMLTFFLMFMITYAVVISITLMPQNLTIHNQYKTGWSKIHIYTHIILPHDKMEERQPYINVFNTLVGKFKAANFYLYFLANDVSEKVFRSVAEKRNSKALDKLMIGDYQVSSNDPRIKTMLLSEYLNDCQVKEPWNASNNDKLEFLARLQAVWEGVGIAFNLRKYLGNNKTYTSKIDTTIRNYIRIHLKATKKIKPKKKTVNNIQDILKSIDFDESYATHINLTGEESKIFQKEVSHKSRIRRETYSKDAIKVIKVNENTTKNESLNNVNFLRTFQTRIIQLLFPNTLGDKTNVTSDRNDNKSNTRHVKSRYERNVRSDEILVDSQGDIITTHVVCNAFVDQLLRTFKDMDSSAKPTEIVHKALSVYCDGKSHSNARCRLINVLE